MWRRLRRFFLLKHWYRYDEDGKPRRVVTISELMEISARFALAAKIIDNVSEPLA